MKISIEANIGAGKTTLLTKLCRNLRIPVFLEPVTEWTELLSLFYEDPMRWGMTLNLKVLMSFNKWKHNNFFALYERSPVSNRYVFAQLQYEQNRMNKTELDMFGEVYTELHWIPDVVIYIRTDPAVSMTRIAERARQCEHDMPVEYVEAIHEKHEELYVQGKVFEYGVKSVIVIDGNKSADEVYEEVVRELNTLRNTKPPYNQ